MEEKLKKLATEEEMNEFWKPLIEKDKKKRQRVLELVYNYDYINWLENFTKTHSSFADDDWLYFPENLSKQDYERVRELSIFYNVIKKYADKNYIYEKQNIMESAHHSYNTIKYNGNIYKVGLVIGQGSYHYCKRIDEATDKTIDFKDIVENRKSEKTDEISSKLSDLSNMIEEMIKSDVPIEAIGECVDKILIKNYF